MRDSLPPEVLMKSKHGFGLPFNLWLYSSSLLMELAYDSIHDLKKRNYFRPAFLDHLTSQRKIKCDGGSKEKIWSLMMQRLIQQSKCEPGRDSGEIIWVLMMLELWLQTREIDSRFELARQQ
jgi:Asparagine synthase